MLICIYVYDFEYSIRKFANIIDAINTIFLIKTLTLIFQFRFTVHRI